MAMYIPRYLDRDLLRDVLDYLDIEIPETTSTTAELGALRGTTRRYPDPPVRRRNRTEPLRRFASQTTTNGDDMHVLDDLEEALEQVEQHAAAQGLVVFLRAALGGRQADWPGEDPNGLVELAARLDVGLVYIERLCCDIGDIEDWTEQLGPGHPLLDELAERRGQATDGVLAWVRDGVVHSWAGMARWWSEWQDRAETAALDIGERRAVEAREAAAQNIAAWAVQLAASDEFRRAPRPSQASVCRRVIGDIPAEIVEDVVGRAVRAMDAELAPIVRDLKAGGMSKAAIAAKLGITGPAVDRYLVA